MIRIILSLLVAALPATSQPLAPQAPRIGAAPLPGFATTLADHPLTHGPAAWPAKREEDAWRQIVAAVPAERQAARWTFAQSLIGRARAAEALGVLEVMAADDPDLALVPAWQRARGVALVLLGRADEASLALADERLARDPEACLWRVRAAGTLVDLGCAMPALASRSRTERRPFVLAAAAAAIARGRHQPALTWLADLSPTDRGADLLRARALKGIGQSDRATLLLKRVVRVGAADQRAAARLALIEAGIASGGLAPATALRALDELRFGWRGDAVERRALTLSVDLATRSSDLPRTLAAGAVLFRYFDLGAAHGRLLSDLQRHLGSALAAESKLPLAQAAGLFWEYRDLLPAGAAGDRLVDILAARLQRAGLYARAADLLQHRLTGRAEDIEKGPLSVRVASLFILAGDPDRAIHTLRDTDAIAYPLEMHADRRRIEAAALDLLGKSAEALATIQDVADADGLRAEILWRARDWEGLAAQAMPAAGAMTDVAQAGVLRHAIALAMLGREADLTALNARYAASFARLPTGPTFAMLTGELDSADPEMLGRAMAMLPSASPAGAIGDLIAAGDAAMAHRPRR